MRVHAGKRTCCEEHVAKPFSLRNFSQQWQWHVQALKGPSAPSCLRT